MGAFTKDGIKRKQEAISWVIGELEKRKSEIAKNMRESMTIRSDDMELLTTGEMIDKLKVGEIAEGLVKGNEVGLFIYKSKVGHIRFKGSDNLVEMTAGITENTTWRIQPNYVSFEDAMKALKDGKRVIFHAGEEKYQITSSWCLVNDWVNQFNWNDLMENTWTIEE